MDLHLSLETQALFTYHAHKTQFVILFFQNRKQEVSNWANLSSNFVEESYEPGYPKTSLY